MVEHVNPLVRKLSNVANLTAGELEQLVTLCDRVGHVARKRDIISAGKPPTHVHLILDGWAARYTLLPDGSRQIVAFLLPGDFCDMHITILGRMDHGIVALTDCTVAYVPAAKINEITNTTPGLTCALWWATLVDEAILRQWVVNNGRRDAIAAVAHLICELHLRMKMIGLVGDRDQFTLPITQEELSDATGMTPVHMNRVLQRLRTDDLITLESQNLLVKDVDRLRDVAGFNPDYLHIRSENCAR